MAINVIICGINGKMGQAVAKLIRTKDEFILTGTVSSAEKLQDVVAKTSSQAVIIDFSNSTAALQHAHIAAELRMPIVIGVSGLTETDLITIKQLSQKTPILIATNTSIGANVLHILCKLTAKIMQDTDIELLDIHHKHKKDSPSGTALNLAKAMAHARDQTFDSNIILSRHDRGARKPNEIGVFGLRGGTELGEQAVYFLGDDERLTLSHNVLDRTIYAKGALKAAIFIASKHSGCYDMIDTLKLDNITIS